MNLIKSLKVISAATLTAVLAAVPTWAEEAKDDVFTAVVTSDLHYTQKEKSITAIVPGVRCAEEIIRTFASEVIDLKPDAWIITGDLTNSGSADDVEALAQILQQAADQGIEVISITGNHDFDKGEIGTFEEAFLGMPDMLSRDSASLSYSVKCKNVRILAMDDAGGTDDRYGARAEFSETTMNWLRGQLEEAQNAGEQCIFLAHRSVLFRTSYDAGVDYTIRNVELENLLREYSVQLCLTGHQHSQSILEADGMYEIISCMPLTGSHRFGWLSIDERGTEYDGRMIDFEKYGEGDAAETVAAADKEAAVQTEKTVVSILGEGASADATELLAAFFGYYEEGTIGEHAAEILEDEAWPEVNEAIAETNYGPWITNLLDNPPRDAFHLEF